MAVPDNFRMLDFLRVNGKVPKRRVVIEDRGYKQTGLPRLDIPANADAISPKAPQAGANHPNSHFQRSLRREDKP